MRLRAHWLQSVALVVFATAFSIRQVGADMVDMTGVEPWDVCGGCHGLDGAGNNVKFPRLAGQKPAYIVKQLIDFRAGRRENDGGQMVKIATELAEAEILSVAEWFARQTPVWPKPTMEESADPARARQLATAGADGIPACLSCHNGFSLTGRGPRLAGQRDFYIAKQLADFRAGRRDNDPDKVMQTLARQLTEADIAALAVFLSQNPDLHETAP